MTVHDDLAILRRALGDVERALRPLQERPASRRLVQRLSSDLHRMQEDVADLAEDGLSERGGLVPQARDFEPVPVPPRDLASDYDPSCEDEGLAGWREPAGAEPPRDGRRR